VIYYAECFAKPYGGGWAVAETPEEALKRARRNVGETARHERASYVLEFPDNANVSCGSELYGGYRANVHPLRIVSKHKITMDDNALLGR
jgi:hypothetical protein